MNNNSNNITYSGYEYEKTRIDAYNINTEKTKQPEQSTYVVEEKTTNTVRGIKKYFNKLRGRDKKIIKKEEKKKLAYEDVNQIGETVTLDCVTGELEKKNSCYVG